MFFMIQLYKLYKGEVMKLTGKVSTIIYINETNSYTVMLLKLKTDYIHAVGQTHELQVGDEIELEGIYDVHKTYGDQFKFSSYTKVLPKDEGALIQYISDNVKGVGKKLARNIIDMYGSDAVDIIKNSPNKLMEISGMNDKKMEALNEYFNTEWEKWNIASYLFKYNISIIMANKIYESLGADTINIVKQNPYSLLKFVKTLDFKVVDEIGKQIGIELDNMDRLEAGIIYAMNKVTEFGHTCVQKSELITYASDILQVSKEAIEVCITSLILLEKLYILNIENLEYVFRRSFYLAEENIAKNVIEFTKQKQTNKSYKKEIEEVSEHHSLVLSDEQKEAIATCLNKPISIITGGPGTGKTTIIKCIIDILEKLDKSYLLCAPTGRAAKRMTQTTGKEAKTLHRLLEITKLDDKDIDMFLDYAVKELDEDVVIVDESSMIDCLMMNNLFKAITPKTKIIFVGDVNQLPSVGAGNVLKDIIDSQVVNVVLLKHIYRQSIKSEIIVNAHKVNNGEYPSFRVKDTDLFYISTNNVDSTISQLSSLLTGRLEKFIETDMMTNLQILTPMRKMELGTIGLNKIIQEILNPKSSDKKEKEYSGKVFRQGDKVMQIVNNYDKKFTIDGQAGEGIYNGDIGYITQIDTVSEKLTIRYDEMEIEYNFEELDQIEHAYAITIHKSQGSEFDYVILPIYGGYPKLFTRNLLYTAMTRAKKMLIIIGNKTMINYMVDNVEERKRKTGLKYKILSLI